MLQTNNLEWTVLFGDSVLHSQPVITGDGKYSRLLMHLDIFSLRKRDTTSHWKQGCVDSEASDGFNLTDRSFTLICVLDDSCVKMYLAGGLNYVLLKNFSHI